MVKSCTRRQSLTLGRMAKKKRRIKVRNAVKGRQEDAGVKEERQVMKPKVSTGREREKKKTAEIQIDREIEEKNGTGR